MTRQILVGGIPIGGGAPVTIQSMNNTKTHDVAAMVAQIAQLAAAGCEITRVAVPDERAAQAIGKIVAASPIPVVADIHFDYRLALLCAEAGIHKIRINPGNIGGRERVQAVAEACGARNIPIRIGVNGGSLHPELLRKYGGVTAGALAESALSQAAMLAEFDFQDICISIKSSHVKTMMAAYRLVSDACDYPLHLGVTEAGTLHMGTVKSAIGIGGLLADGIGDTLRVTLTADPVEEVRIAKDILQAVGLRRAGVEIISCPTCGRTNINLFSLVEQVEQRVKGIKTPLTVAIMGCAVNGPGEARHADFGIAGGDGEGLIFAKGEIIRKVPQEQLVEELMREMQAHI